MPRRTLIAVATLLLATGATSSASSARVGPGGTFVYSTAVDGTPQLFSMRADGTSRRQLTRGPATSGRGAWSPDGKRIAFERIPADGSRAAVVVMNADGSGARELTPTGYQGMPSFTPDGRSLVYTRDLGPTDNGVWSMKIDGTGTRRLTRNPFMRGGVCGCDELAKVSPDGRRVAFIRVKVDHKQAALFTVGIDGTRLRQVLPYTPDVFGFDWSPDGKRLAVTLPDPEPGERVSANVFTFPAGDPTRLRAVTHLKDGHTSAFLGAYSPDGRWMAFTLGNGAKPGLYLARPDGSGLRRIADAPSEPVLDWRAAS